MMGKIVLSIDSAMTDIPIPQRQSTKIGSRLLRLRRITRVMDTAIAIPGTKIKFGIDPLLGLIPGGGDTVSLLISGYIVIEAALMGLPRNLLMQMALNLVLDTILGTVPVAGDLFDLAYKANVQNLEILESHFRTHMAIDPGSAKVDRLFLAALIIGLILFAIALCGMGIVVMSLIKVALGW
jgi:hypothetical protein